MRAAREPPPALPEREAALPGIFALRERRERALTLAAEQRLLVEAVTAGRDHLWGQLQRTRSDAIRARLSAIARRHRTVVQRLIFGDAFRFPALRARRR